MRCYSRALPGVLAIILLVNPSLVLSRRRFEERRQNETFESETEIHPVAMFIAGTVSVAGSLFSLHKHRRQLSLNKKQKAAAADVVQSYKDQQEMGCRLLDQTTVQMVNKRKSLVRLIEDDRNGTRALATSCLFNGRMEHFQKNLENQFGAACALLDVHGAPGKLKEFQARCDEVGQAGGSVAGKICSTNGDGLAKAIRRTDLVLARLDGVMTGLCDGLPGFERSLPTIKPKSASSLIARQVSGESAEAQFPLAVNALTQLENLNTIALGFSALGTLDFGLDLYDTAVKRNDGYTVLLDVVKQDINRQKRLLWNSFQVYWLDIAWLRAVQLATLAERYQAATLSVPDHLSTMTRADTAQRWHKYGQGPRDGSYWACNSKLKCLVPVWHGTAHEAFERTNKAAGESDREPIVACSTNFGDLRMCESASNLEIEVFAPVKEVSLAPRRCFGIYYGGKGLSQYIKGNMWIFHYGKNDHVMTGHGDEYSEVECLEPLRNLAQSTQAESDLRNHLIEMSSEKA